AAACRHEKGPGQRGAVPGPVDRCWNTGTSGEGERAAAALREGDARNRQGTLAPATAKGLPGKGRLPPRSKGAGPPPASMVGQPAPWQAWKPWAITSGP